MDFTSTGLKRPADTDTMGSSGATLRQHANSIQAGSVTKATTAATTVNGTVTFPTAYVTGTIPRVIVTPVTNVPDTVRVSVTTITATGFTYFIYRPTGFSGNIDLQWVAVGKGLETGGA